MNFLDEVESLKAKLGIGTTNPLALLGVAFGALVVIGAVVVLVWGGFTEPGVVVEHETESESAQIQEESSSPETFCVHVAGAVASPGMYELPQGSRVSDAVNAAGGMTESADQLSVNLARMISDGEQIVVQEKVDERVQNPSSDSVRHDASEPAAQALSSQGKLNINTASPAELTALDGIGDATAEKIVAYRQANGSFSSIEEIKKVSGIGDKKFEAIKDSITV